MTPNISIQTGGFDLLWKIRPLWEELNRHHESRSPYFKDTYRKFTFDSREKTLKETYSADYLKVEFAMDTKENRLVGYCISGIHDDGIGELESIYIKPEYRQSGIGGQLAQSAIDWFTRNHVQETVVKVSFGNEEAFPFYARYGFFPRVTVLRHSAHETSDPG